MIFSAVSTDLLKFEVSVKIITFAFSS